jgi:hypothetical protein
MPQTIRFRSQFFLVAGVLLQLTACRTVTPAEPKIEFSLVPPEGDGSPDQLRKIEGRVTGAMSGDRIVLFARSGVWWVQPFGSQPFTEIQTDATWKSQSHPGSAYAAMLVDARYHPPLTVQELPDKGGPVRAVATVKGGPVATPLKTVAFSGYQWDIRETSSDAGGSKNFYDPANVWTDNKGSLHLAITRQSERWVCAEVKLSRSLGYGSYRFVVQDVAHLEPAAVFGLLTWDDSGPREMDIEISKWGEPADKNAQYVIQPYVIPANSVRFTAPAGTLTYWLDWQPGRAVFKTVRGSSSTFDGGDTIAEHVFTSGIPSPGDERIHMILYVFDNRNAPMQRGTEVILDKFEFLP